MNKRILKANPYMPTHLRGNRSGPHLSRASPYSRPLATVAKKLVGGPIHEEKVIEFCRDTAKYPHDELQEDWRLEHALIHAELQAVEVANIIALVLESLGDRHHQVVPRSCGCR